MIEVQLLNDVGYIWRKEDAEKLRVEHRIVGNLVGFTPKTFNESLPMMLLPEEMKVLVDLRIIKLYSMNKDILSKGDVLLR